MQQWELVKFVKIYQTCCKNEWRRFVAHSVVGPLTSCGTVVNVIVYQTFGRRCLCSEGCLWATHEQEKLFLVIHAFAMRTIPFKMYYYFSVFQVAVTLAVSLFRLVEIECTHLATRSVGHFNNWVAIVSAAGVCPFLQWCIAYVSEGMSQSVQLVYLFTRCNNKKMPLCKINYYRDGSELSYQIFRHCSWYSLPSALLVSEWVSECVGFNVPLDT